MKSLISPISMTILILLIGTHSLCEVSAAELLPIGDAIYLQTKGFDLVSDSSGDQSYRKVDKGEKSYYKIVGHHRGWAYHLKRVNGSGEEIDSEIYWIGAEVFGKGTRPAAIDDLIRNLNQVATRSTVAPKKKHCSMCEQQKLQQQKGHQAKQSAAGLIEPAKFQASDRAIKMIQEFEGCIRCGYLDVKQYSIGYGTHLKGNWSLSGDEERVANNQCLALRKGRACTANKKAGFDRLRMGCLCKSKGGRKKAGKMMRDHLKNTRLIEFMRREIKVPLKQHQVDVLVSWYYNFGKRAYDPQDPEAPTFSHYINAGDMAEGAKRMSWWRKSAGKVNKGLMMRRAMEHHMFIHGKPLAAPRGSKQMLDYYYKVSGAKR
jgi:GH24 family phage-related lysozyme (muramidase)